MKNLIAFAVLIVGISAIPNAKIPSFFGHEIDLRDQRLVTDAIASAIEDVSQSIKDAGLDPLYIESDSGTLALPVPVLFSAEGVVESFLFTGLSNIVINNLSFNIITYRLTFDISLPQIDISAKKSELDVVFFGEDYSASASGTLTISNININGNVRVRVGVISGISLRSLDLYFSLGGISSAVNVVVQNWDMSDSLNTLLGTTIPFTLDKFSAEINEVLEYYATIIIEANL